MKHHHFVQPVHEFRRKLASRRFHRRALHLFVQPVVRLVLGCTNPIPPVISSVISPPPRFDVRKITVCDRSTRRLSPSVNVALSRIPSSNCHSASEAFSISSNSRKRQLQLVRVTRRQRFLRDQRMRFAMPQVAWRRADQLGDFVRVLEFRAIHLDHRARIAEQNFRRRFHDARLARTRRAQETAGCPPGVPANSIPRKRPGTGPPAPARLRPARQSWSAA